MTTSADSAPINPVLVSARHILKVKTNNNPHVQVSAEVVHRAADKLLDMMETSEYSPATWRTQPLHLVPPTPFDGSNSKTKQCLDWIFLVSALNFSFWSELEGKPTRYGVIWKSSWTDDSGLEKKWEGYWSLLAALNKALEKGIPITDPTFYGSAERCPDSIIEEVFQPAEGCSEPIPLLKERMAIMREVGRIFIEDVPGQCYMGLIEASNSSHDSRCSGTRRLLYTVVQRFPCFRDEPIYQGEKVFFWKRAQILIAETWAAFYPSLSSTIHPFLPEGVDELTMFADYRVPQILQNLEILCYSPELKRKLIDREDFPYGSDLECSIRAGSIVAVEEIKGRMEHLQTLKQDTSGRRKLPNLNSVLIDFFLWDLAKLVESDKVSTISASPSLPCHRTRSIYY